MPKIAFLGAGSTVFTKNVVGDCLCTDALRAAEIALYDIDGQRLQESLRMVETLNANVNGGRAKIRAYLGPGRRRAALRGADYIVNAIQVGGYKPSTVVDFEAPKKYGLRQTIGDTLGIGGIFRALRTIPVLEEFARDIAEVCPSAWFLNYTNPMSILTGALLKMGVRTVGLCHSVQVCAGGLLRLAGMQRRAERVQWKIAGINHQGWLLEITDRGRDLYPAIKRRVAASMERIDRGGGAGKFRQRALWEAARQGLDLKGDHQLVNDIRVTHDLVRLTLMLRFGCYLTESSVHSAEYMPYWIKRTHPELLARFGIALDEYPRRCIRQIENWRKMSRELVGNPTLQHTRSHEYASRIMHAMETGAPEHIGGNVLNTGLIPNLPAEACVEVPCLVDRNGVQGCYAGNLPEACAALNRTAINVHLLTLAAAFSRRRDHVYQAALLDPHTAAELSMDEIVSLCDDMLRAHGKWLPKFR